MWGLHLHPHNDTTPTEAPIITPFKHIGNSFIYSTKGHHTACMQCNLNCSQGDSARPGI